MKKNNSLEFETMKEKILKYILYKKRTVNEVRKKFENEDQELVEEIITYFKEINYLNDSEYIVLYVKELMKLKKLSIIELKHKLLYRGLKEYLIEDYLDLISDKLNVYEFESAKNICIKKSNTMTDEKLVDYLAKKGYDDITIETVIKMNK